jgi:hypothetical protein
LIERGVIDDRQLAIVLEAQKKNGGYLSQHLISLGYASEMDIANCLSSQYGFPYIPLGNYAISEKILEVIPIKLVKIYSVLPIDRMGEVLSIAMADPLNDGVIEMLRQITNYDIRVFISTYTEISKAIERYFGLQLKKQTDEFGMDTEDELRKDITQPFIQTTARVGIERRRCARVNVDLDVTYFIEGKSYKGNVKNLSYIGIYFICPSFISIDTNIYANFVARIKLEEAIIYSVIQVVRVETIKEIKEINGMEVASLSYGIAGFFNFITNEDKEKLKAFLKIQFQKETQTQKS